MSYGSGVGERIAGTHLCFNLHYQANGHATTGQDPPSASGCKRVPSPTRTTGPGIGLGSETFIVNGQELAGRFTAQVTQDILPPGIKTVPEYPRRFRQLSLDRRSADSRGDGGAQHPAAHAPARPSR